MTTENQDNLRKRAEAKLGFQQFDVSKMSEDFLHKTLHELHTHKIELELQNEDLQLALVELEKTRAMYQDLYEHAPVGYLTVSDNGLITKANFCAYNMLGLEKKLLPKQPFSSFLATTEDSDRHYLSRKKLLETKEPTSCVLQILSKNGEKFDAQCKYAIIPQLNDSTEQLSLVISDISQLKKAEDEKLKLQLQLKQAQKMEAIGTLAGGIAHDFNNLLAVISGYTSLAMEDAPPESKFKGELENVSIAANRASGLIKQILTFSRQATSVERIPLNIEILVKESLKMLRSSFPTTITITKDIDSKCGTVLADPTQIHQILMNLCTNAYHAMEETGGDLSVSLKSACIGADTPKKLLQHLQPGEYVELIVSDTGVGIGPDLIEKIFDPYFTTKAVGKGTGLGLAITYGIIKDCEGTITVESLLGKGTTFHVYLPVVKMEALPALTKSEDIPKGTERILFIDDELLLAEMGKNVLERLGYQVTVRQNSLEALSTFQDSPNKFDLVITDQTMPGLTGSDIARRMLLIRPDIPIILCTGYSSLIDEDSAKALGIKEFALKPYSKKDMAKLIRKALDG